MRKSLGKQVVRGHYELISDYINTKSTYRQLSKLMRVSMPYTTVTLKNGDELPLNRDYKPLGMPPGSCLDYEDFSGVTMPTEAINKEAGYNVDNNGVYLFDDSCPPWKGKRELMAYMKRVPEVFKL